MPSQNHNVNGGPTMGGAGPKDSTMGKDTGGEAKNVLKGWGINPPEASPSATNQSRNKGSKGKGK